MPFVPLCFFVALSLDFATARYSFAASAGLYPDQVYARGHHQIRHSAGLSLELAAPDADLFLHHHLPKDTYVLRLHRSKDNFDRH